MENKGIKFIASVNENSIKDVHQIAERLRRLGCEVENVLAFSGIITGSASPETALGDLKIEGIKHIEPDRKTGLME